MPDSLDTLPESERNGSAAGSVELLCLSIAWSAEESWRIGEVALVPGGRPGPVRMLGRGGPASDDAFDRLPFVRLRGSCVEPRPPLDARRVSRLQLRVRETADGSLEVENVGRLPLEKNGVLCAQTLARPGDVLQLGGQLLFVVVRRQVPRSLSGESVVTDFPFGFADAGGLVGESDAAWALRQQIAFVGPRRGHVLISGPSGSGKELVARAVHAASERASHPMWARNAATIPEGIVDAELFGNARNYPNAGAAERAGLIGDADGTSLLLDEFGELPVPVQAHLLRVLDDGEYQRLGESRMRRSDFRLIAATNRPLSVLKDDVLARLSFRITVPDLNSRKEDVPLLARHLLSRILSTDPAVAHRFATPDGAPRVPALSLRLVRDLILRDYTTHARELEGILWRALERGGSELIESPVEMSPGRAQAGCKSLATLPVPGAPDDEVSVEAIRRSLDAHNGFLEGAWRDLGLSSRHALARLMRKHGIEIRKRSTR